MLQMWGFTKKLGWSNCQALFTWKNGIHHTMFWSRYYVVWLWNSGWHGLCTLTLSSVVLPLAEIHMYSHSLPTSRGQTSMNCCLLISSTRSSKGLSRIISLLGFRSTSKTAIQHVGQQKLFRILIGGIHIHMVSFLSLNLNLYLESELYHLMLGCINSQKAESTSNGLVMTPRLWWRCVVGFLMLACHKQCICRSTSLPSRGMSQITW